MARLPNISDLGARPIPQSGARVTSTPGVGAIGEAVSGLGEQLYRTGQAKLQQQDKLAYNAAQGQYLAEDIKARQDLEQDPDFSKAVPRYQERMKAARASAIGVIQNRSDRTLLEQELGTLQARGEAAVSEMVRGKQVVAKRAVLLSDLDTRHDVGMAALDEVTKISTIEGAKGIIQGAVGQGIIDPVQAVTMSRDWTSTYNASQISTMLVREDVTAAKAYFDKTRAMIDPGTAATLEGRINSALNFRESLTDFDRANPLPQLGAKPATGQPAADGAAVIRALYPKATVTSGYRSPDHPLSKANPKSWHTNSHAAVDVAPIKGMTFESYVQGIKDAGYNIIEAKNEVGEGRSAHATGDHWHVVVGNGSGPQQSARRWDAETTLANIDALADREGWSPERRERAKGRATERISRDEQLLSREQAEADRTAQEIILKRRDAFTDTSQIPLSVWGKMSVSQRSSAMTLAAQNRVPKEPKPNGIEVMRMHILQGMRPDVFKGMDLTPLIGKVTSAELDTLLTEQARMRDPANVKDFSPRSKISETISYHTKTDKELRTALDPESNEVAYGNVMHDMERYVSEVTAGKRLPTQAELDAAFGRAAMKVIVEGEGWFGRDMETPRYALKGGETYRVEVPDDVRQRIIGSYRRVRGTIPNETAIVQEYVRYKGRFWD